MKDWRFILLGIGFLVLALCCGVWMLSDSQPVYAGIENAFTSSAEYGLGGDKGGGGSDTGDYYTGNAKVWTDKADYASWETPIIKGSGFASELQVTLTVTTPSNIIYSAVTKVDGDGGFGMVFKPSTGLELGRYLVTATDGYNYAETTFTDANIKVTVEAWGNLTEEWTKNPINHTNSSYVEGQVIPFRMTIENPGTTPQSFTINYDYSKSNIYGIDYLTTYNAFIAPDPPPSGVPTSTYAITGGTGNFIAYNATITAVSATITSIPGSPGTENREITIWFTPNGTDPAYIMWGAHLAVESAPDEDDGSGHWPGGASMHVYTDPQPFHSETQIDNPAVLNASIDVEKDMTSNADEDGSGTISEGDTLTYTYTVENDGNVTLTNVSVVDTPLGSVTLSDTAGNGIAVLAPGDIETGTLTYVVIQADVDAGEIYNEVLATGYYDSEPYTDTDDVTVLIPRNASIDVDKDMTSNADEDGSGTVTIGDTLTYIYTVENDGNVTLTNVSVVDTPLGSVTLSDTAGNGIAVLAPGDIETGTLTHVVTQADVDAGEIYNEVLATGYFNSIPYTDTDDVTVLVGVNGIPSIDVEKDMTSNADEDGSGTISEGDTLTYTYTVENDGTVTLTNVSVVDTPLGSVTLSDTAGNGIAVLAPGDIETGTLTYVVIQADVDAGEIYNEVLATGYFDSEPYDDTDDLTVLIPQNASIDVEKDMTSNADEDGSGTISVGDTLTYTYTVENDGNVTLTNVSVVDTPLGSVTLSDTAGNGITVLAPGDIETGTLTYVVTQADVDAGEIYNEVLATGYFDSEPYDDTDDLTVLIQQNPSLNITKTADVTSVDAAGEVISYNIEVENTGNVTLTGVTVVDPMLGILIGPSGDDGNGVLDVGETWTYTGTYTVTQADIDADEPIQNTATADSNESEQDTDDVLVDVSPLYPLLQEVTYDTSAAECGYVITIDWFGTVRRYPCEENGALCANVLVQSPDGYLILSIPYGTIVLNADGTPAYLNTDPDVLGQIAGTPPSAGGKKLLRVYILTPQGLIFERNTPTIVMNYSDADAAGAQLVWAVYDAQTGQWVELETAGYVAAGTSIPNTAASRTGNTFTYFAIIAK